MLHTAIACVIVFLFASFDVFAATTYDSDDTYVYMNKVNDITCPMNQTCSHNFSHNVATGYTQAEIFLSKWEFQIKGPLSAMYGLGDEISRIQLEIDKTAYNSTTGTFDWNLTADMRSANGEEFEITVFYTIVLSKNAPGNQISTFLSRYSNSCSGDETGSCNSGYKNHTGSRPPTTTFAGYAIRGFNIGTRSGNHLALSELRIDLAHDAVNTSTTTMRQDLHCGMIGDINATTPEPTDCSVSSIGISINTNHVHSVESFFHDGSYPNPNVYAYLKELTFVPSSTLDGVFVGQKAFKVNFDSNYQDMTYAIGTGCTGLFPNPGTSPEEVSVQHESRIQSSVYWPWMDFESQNKCVVGQLLP